MRSLGWDQVAARRLARSSLDARAPRERLLDVVRETCGVHAQLASGAELAISARVDDVTAGEVQDALAQSRELVKAATVRGTLHLHPADDFPLWKALGGFGARWRQQFWLNWQGLTLAEASSCASRCSASSPTASRAPAWRSAPRSAGDWASTSRPTRGATTSRRRRIASATVRRGAAASRSSAATAGSPAGASSIRARRAVEACRRHLAAYGPVRRDELEHWLSQKLPDDVFAELAAGLEEVDVDGHRALVPAGTTFPDAGRAACGCSAITTST